MNIKGSSSSYWSGLWHILLSRICSSCSKEQGGQRSTDMIWGKSAGGNFWGYVNYPASLGKVRISFISIDLLHARLHRRFKIILWRLVSLHHTLKWWRKVFISRAHYQLRSSVAELLDCHLTHHHFPRDDKRNIFDWLLKSTLQRDDATVCAGCCVAEKRVQTLFAKRFLMCFDGGGTII